MAAEDATGVPAVIDATGRTTRRMQGPKFDPDVSARLLGRETGTDQGPSWRGWVLGLGCCAFMAWIIPTVDFVIRHTRLTLNVLPASSMFFSMVFILLFNYGLSRWHRAFALRRQDVALVFCMLLVTNALPGNCGLSGIVSGMLSLSNYSSPENGWRPLFENLIPRELCILDPTDMLAKPRPSEWFYSGLPKGESIPWAVLIQPFMWWCLALCMILGMYMALATLLKRQWSDREQLPFPQAQIPAAMWRALPPFGEEIKSVSGEPFFMQRLAWWGIGIAFFLHGWNNMRDYVPNWEPIPLINRAIDGKYLTEPPLIYLRPIHVNLYPSVIALMYLISVEVSFSLWFFYILLKIGIVIAVAYFALGTDGNNDITLRPFQWQGNGAFFGLGLAALFMARQSLWASFKRALGLLPMEEGEAISPRFPWVVLIGCFVGAILWLVKFGANPIHAFFAIVLFLLAGIACARMVAEGGIVLMQSKAWPSNIIDTFVSPYAQGVQSHIAVRNWSWSFSFNEFRILPMVTMLGALHAASLARLRLKPLLLGMTLAIAMTLGIGFVSYMKTCYETPGGASTLGWFFYYEPRDRYTFMSTTLKEIKSYDKKVVEATKEGREVPESETPTAALPDYAGMKAIGVGAGVLFLFLFLRTRLFWFPHPIGYVMWMGPYPFTVMSFSFFIGWLVKTMVSRFGGQRVYLKWQPFFIGLVLGEAVSSIFWIAIAWYTGHQNGYKLEYQ